MTEPPLTWLDERGRRCPQPIIALARAAAASPGGTVLRLLSDDPAAQYDVPAWCRMKGMHLLATMAAPDGAGGTAFVVEIPSGQGLMPGAAQA
jgi:tRNA 2-thiouridine synthesizing protein A